MGITFSSQQKELIVLKIQQYCLDELDQELGQFDAEFLLDFFSKEIGGYYYNQGLYDARAIFESKVEAIDEAIYAIEKTID